MGKKFPLLLFFLILIIAIVIGVYFFYKTTLGSVEVVNNSSSYSISIKNRLGLYRIINSAGILKRNGATKYIIDSSGVGRLEKVKVNKIVINFVDQPQTGSRFAVNAGEVSIANSSINFESNKVVLKIYIDIVAFNNLENNDKERYLNKFVIQSLFSGTIGHRKDFNQFMENLANIFNESKLEDISFFVFR